MKLKGKCIVLGVCGGIAAYKSAELLRALQKMGADVYVIMTKNACEFITPLTLETLSGHPVVSDMFARIKSWEVEHVALAKRADLFLLAPATANIMGKMACGIADDMLSTTVMATRAPVLIAPAMNTGMWESTAVKVNRQTLVSRGYHFVGPAEGYLACGDSGAGKMSSPEEIAVAAAALLTAGQDMKGKRVLVTAGPTREPIDPVRYLSNRSSGKMGYAIAKAAQERGADVTLLSGIVALSAPANVKTKYFTTTHELLDLALECAPENDIVIQAAAPGDYRVLEIADQKIKKQKGDTLTLSLVENPDVAATIGAMKRTDQTFVAFAAETQLVVEHARQKLTKKNVDMIVANDVTQKGAGFDVDTNIITLITASSQLGLPLMTKTQGAHEILNAILSIKKTENE